MIKIAILGLGNLGTALARVWLVGGVDEVAGWTIEEEVYDSIKADGVNRKYLDHVSLEGLKVTMDIEAAVDGAEIVALAVPSSVVLTVVDSVLPYLKDEQILLDLAKGLAPGDEMISHVIESKLAAAGLDCKLCVMMGPNIAAEMATGVYTRSLVTSSDFAAAEKVAGALTTKTLRLTAGTDSLGSEYWGAMKNVIALACGVVDGLRDDGRGGDNLKAALFTAGFSEAVRVLPLLGAEPDTAFTAAGIGDLFVTATSPHGRNREMGERLGRGQTLEQAQKEMVMVSEGVRAARMFKQLFASKGIDAPFVTAVCDLLNGVDSIDEFLERAHG